MSKPCVYISGPMSGLPESNYPAFNEVANHLRLLGYPVINPADFGSTLNHSWSQCLARDLAVLVHCEVVVKIKGWQNSKGAILECHVAEKLGMPIYTLAEFLEIPR